MPTHNADIAAIFTEIADTRFGIGRPRRGWLEAGDVLNTRPLPELRHLLAQVRR